MDQHIYIQKNKCTLDEWYTYMDKEYGITFDFDYLLSHPDWCLGKEDSLEKQGVIGKIPLSFVKKVRRFRAKTDKSISKIRSDNWDNRKENRIKKMNRKLRKRNDKQKKNTKATYTKLKHISKYSKKLWIEYTNSILFFILSTL